MRQIDNGLGNALVGCINNFIKQQRENDWCRKSEQQIKCTDFYCVPERSCKLIVGK